MRVFMTYVHLVRCIAAKLILFFNLATIYVYIHVAAATEQNMNVCCVVYARNIARVQFSRCGGRQTCAPSYALSSYNTHKHTHTLNIKSAKCLTGIEVRARVHNSFCFIYTYEKLARGFVCATTMMMRRAFSRHHRHRLRAV